jgi:hypothetical protein
VFLASFVADCVFAVLAIWPCGLTDQESFVVIDLCCGKVQAAGSLRQKAAVDRKL